MPVREMAKVVSNSPVKPGYYLMELDAPKVTEEAKPGQFVHIRVGRTMDPLLRRPISLYDIDKEKGILSLLYVVVGRGTRMLSEIEAGAELDIMGPLGNGFWLPDRATRCLVVGGGIGVAPLLPLIGMLDQAGLEQKILYGFRNADAVVGIDVVQEKGWPLAIATDDGSVGHRGFVTDLVKQAITDFKPDYYYVCGPEVMIRNVVWLMKEANIPGQVSLEARMGCGVGACLACTCKTRKRTGGQQSVTGGQLSVAGHEQNFDYSLVCTHGPVFGAGEVIFDD
ncbi:dihydroorotate dehydrogenase electron transfer subunit [Thermincola potens]|uniref:Dihydroorotate dehydrogenase B (NAD(+)), electron transfer subunit n=1 Tax=Thermincola potens (strain JR) TaxID=635013 RepID=D5X7V8_THEPJ|nr:dihydroorotate dehydrogenase electron transfer subunit [Thermincola potens]ADG82678.1 Dihydroorotate dehydrogenase, electron transfer subunit, iron-sulfur cluster binding domain protein [Thermincola potens JR]